MNVDEEMKAFARIHKAMGALLCLVTLGMIAALLYFSYIESMQ